MRACVGTEEPPVTATLLALGAIALWATLASLGVALAPRPAVPAHGRRAGHRQRSGVAARAPLARAAASTLLLGVVGLFGFHFLLFVALRHAPPIEANLVNYLWPLLIVVLAPVFLPAVRLRAVHVLAALAGFAGAALAILGGARRRRHPGLGLPAGARLGLHLGQLLAAHPPRAALSTAAIGLFGLVSGLLALACHAALEPATTLTARDWMLLAVTGLGPLGAAFFLWDAALKRGDPVRIGILSYLTPLASTLLLAATTGRPLTAWIGVAAVLIVGSAVVGMRAR